MQVRYILHTVYSLFLVLEILSKNQSQSQEIHIQHSEINNEAKSNDKTDISDGHRIVPVDTGSEQRNSDISGECIQFYPTDYDVSVAHKSRDDHIKNDHAEVTSVGSSAFTTIEMLTM